MLRQILDLSFQPVLSGQAVPEAKFACLRTAEPTERQDGWNWSTVTRDPHELWSWRSMNGKVDVHDARARTRNVVGHGRQTCITFKKRRRKGHE